MTPQVARIDARHMPQDSPARLCYLGTTLRTHADGLSGSRSPVQVGAELYGHAGIESDCEAVCLMAATLECLNVTEVHLDLGHVGVFRTLVARANLDQHRELDLLEAMQRKAVDDVDAVLANVEDDVAREHLRALIELNGGSEILASARSVLSAADDEVLRCIDDLTRLIELLQHRGISLPVHVDLAELRGYRYHTGVVFAAFVPGQGQEVARGGRYDDIERVYGTPRAATGFSSDLKALVSLAGGVERQPQQASLIEAPWSDDASLLAAVSRLRESGERVVFALPSGARVDGVTRALRQSEDGSWTIVKINSEQTRK
jgi:ATP phosphoribosyltransferase regulatory subunit